MSREAFEKWFTGEEDTKTRSSLMALDAKGFYIYQVAYNAWNAWQACQSAQSKRIAELEAENEAIINALANDTAKYMIKRVELQEQIAELVETLTKLRDCDWVITLPDRMDAVRNIAREALAKVA